MPYAACDLSPVPRPAIKRPGPGLPAGARVPFRKHPEIRRPDAFLKNGRGGRPDAQNQGAQAGALRSMTPFFPPCDPRVLKRAAPLRGETRAKPRAFTQRRRGSENIHWRHRAPSNVLVYVCSVHVQGRFMAVFLADVFWCRAPCRRSNVVTPPRPRIFIHVSEKVTARKFDLWRPEPDVLLFPRWQTRRGSRSDLRSCRWQWRGKGSPPFPPRVRNVPLRNIPPCSGLP